MPGMKRENYIDWNDYFMAIAYLSSKRSKDPKTQVGACIVNEDKKIVGTGYNGMPIGCHDDLMPWGKGDSLETDKHLYVCHAELNAVVNKNAASLKNCTIYVTLFPCNECTKLLIQSGIKWVIYAETKDKKEYQASRKMMDMVGVKYSQFKPTQSQIQIDFPANEDMAGPSNVHASMSELESTNPNPADEGNVEHDSDVEHDSPSS